MRSLHVLPAALLRSSRRRRDAVRRARTGRSGRAEATVLMPDVPLQGRRLLAEFVGTGLLVTVVVGSGIAAQRLSPDDVGLQLLENSTATAFGLAVLILMLGPVSGAHFNPVVSAADWLLGRRTRCGHQRTRGRRLHRRPDHSAGSPERCWRT